MKNDSDKKYSDKKYIEIKRWDNDKVIHSGEYESIAECFNAAVEDGKSLRYANLRSANLSSANLSYVDLSYVDLSYSGLSYSDLSYANLSYANLSYVDLSSANLSYANLSYAKNTSDIKFFNHVIGDGFVINSMQFCEYKIAILGDVCCGGCTTKTCQEWLDYCGDELDGDNKEYLEGITKPYIRMILAMREASK